MKQLKFLKEYKQRELYKNFELKEKVLKTILQNAALDSEIKRKMMFKLHNLIFKKYSRSSFVNYCVLSGRTRSVFKFFNLSRISIKDLKNKGMLPNWRSSSW